MSDAIQQNRNHVFISHASADDDFVRELRIKLELSGVAVWVDSRNLRGGDQLRPEIEQAIRTAKHFLVVISPNTINSDWVFDEIVVAEQVQKDNKDFRAIPLMLSGITPKALKRYFSEEPAGEMIELEVGKLQEAMSRILAALGERLPDDPVAETAVQSLPVAELLLKLSRPELTRLDDGSEQLSAEAELEFIPADSTTAREVVSDPFLFIAPIGQIEQDELRWYLEQYLHWPVGLFRERAERLEAQLPQWGEALYTALDNEACRTVLNAWSQLRSGTERRFSVRVDTRLLASASDETKAMVNTAASRLQALPWELLRDENAYLCATANPVHIRRRLPNRKAYDASLLQLPVRILLVSARPEQEGVGYIDHRASALPLVEAVEALGDLVQLTVLTPATLLNLSSELKRAREAGQPYHVLHFDGHGIYDAQYGLGALCFEDAKDSTELDKRGMELVHADKLAELLRDYRIPLVFLEACQTAQTATDPNASVAAKLLEEGIASVVAMTHSMLVKTAQRFVTEFYGALATGKRVGAAMLAGQDDLRLNTYRLNIPGAGELKLQDWFVPILYQEQHDPVLFERLPSERAQRMTAQQRQVTLGRLPETPEHSFIGRSRELLALERLLERQPYAVIRGQGGVGKTTIAVELARWLVRSKRFDRCAFVSVEEYTHDRAVLDVLGQQLVGDTYSVAEYGDDLDKAMRPLLRELENARCLIVVDNLESLLGDSDKDHLAGIFAILHKLSEASLLFTTREPLPAPFNHNAREISLGALSQSDAKALVLQVMNNQGLDLRHDDLGNDPAEVNALVDAVGGHARALVLLARELVVKGVTATTENVRGVMQDLHTRHPGERELSLFASVELSLRHLSGEVRAEINGLAVFHDGGYAFASVLGVDSERNSEIIEELIQVGLAHWVGDYGYVRFDPALSVYLALELDEAVLAGYRARWVAMMGELVGFLSGNIGQDIKLAFSLMQLELPNLMAYLQGLMTGLAAGKVTAEQVVDQLGSVEALLANLNQAQALTQVVAWREQAAQGLGEWSSARFENERMAIERLLQQGDVQGAYQAAEALLQECQQAGEQAYAGADYDLAMAQWLIGRVLETGGAAEVALTYLQQAHQRFEALGEHGAQMASVALTEQGDCLRDLGQLEAAAGAYEEAIELAEKLEDTRQAATGKIQLATVRKNQKRYADALSGYHEALALFEGLGEPGTVATAWHQMGMTYKEMGEYAQAEQAYRQSMAINSQQGSRAGEANSLGELGSLYDEWNRPEQAVSFSRQAADIYVALGDLRYEGAIRNNIADTLIKLQRYDEARPELLRAIECKQAFGHVATPWKTWNILHHLERASGDREAAGAARGKALAAYLAYRRDGGENHSGAGRLCLAVGQAMQQGDTGEVEQVISNALTNPEQDNKDFLYKLQAIISGERDLALAEDEALHYEGAAELILLLEGLNSSTSDIP